MKKQHSRRTRRNHKRKRKRSKKQLQGRDLSKKYGLPPTKRFVSTLQKILSDLEKRKEGTLKKTAHRWQICLGPINLDGVIPSANEITAGVKHSSVSPTMDKTLMSKTRQTTAPYQCKVQNCCWKEWEWSALREHLRTHHGMVTTSNGSLTHWLRRIDFVDLPQCTLTQFFFKWAHDEQKQRLNKLSDSCRDPPVKKISSASIATNAKGVDAVQACEMTHAMTLRGAQLAWAIFNGHKTI